MRVLEYREMVQVGWAGGWQEEGVSPNNLRLKERCANSYTSSSAQHPLSTTTKPGNNMLVIQCNRSAIVLGQSLCIVCSHTGRVYAAALDTSHAAAAKAVRASL